jgi:hypothetical protein
VSAPGTATTAVQIEAYKKLVLVQYLHNGKVRPFYFDIDAG